jgi:mRNA interferase MazF
MYSEGEIVLLRYPHTDGSQGKRRPAVLLKAVPGSFGDWLICMVSTQLHQKSEGLDLVLQRKDADFSVTGLKADSLIRIGRLAVVEERGFELSLGRLADFRLREAQESLVRWLKS